MPKRIFFLFLLLIILPIGGLIIYGSITFQKGETDLSQRQKEYLNEQTNHIKNNLGQKMQEVRLVLRDIMDFSKKEKIFIQEISSPYIKQVFLIDTNGALIYPTLTAEATVIQEKQSNKMQREDQLSSKRLNRWEAEFIDKTTQLWQNGQVHQLFDQMKQYQNKEESFENEYLKFLSQSTQNDEVVDGFFSFYGGKGLNLFYWKKLNSGEYIGADLNISYLKIKLKIISDKLPLKESFFKIIDEKQIVLSQLGDESITNDKSVHFYQEHLLLPLESWKILGYTKELGAIKTLRSSFQTSIYSNLLVLFLIMIVATMIFYYFISKELKDVQKKMNFITEVSHELKTPLTNIRLYAELLENKFKNTDEKSSKYVQVLLDETHRLSRMIHNVLTFRKMKQSNTDINKQNFPAEKVINKCLIHFAPLLSTKNFKIVKEFQLNKNIEADKDHFEQILSNLISNVEKYANSGKFLKIKTCQNQNFAIIECYDQGQPLSNTESKEIFKPFFRINRLLSHGAAGAGIGLTISKELAQQNGGDLVCLPLKDGNCFQLTLPLAKES